MLIAVTPPSGQVVTTADVKARLNLSGTDDDAAIGSMILAAQAMLDGRDGQLNRALLPQTWRWAEQSFDVMVEDFCSHQIRLPLPPTVAVSEVAYYDNTGTKIIVSPSTYRVALGGYHGDILSPVAVAWPYTSSTLYRPDAVQITFSCGYATAAVVPEPIKQALFLIVADMYAFRESGQVGSISTAIQNFPTVEALLEPFKARAL